MFPKHTNKIFIEYYIQPISVRLFPLVLQLFLLPPQEARLNTKTKTLPIIRIFLIPIYNV